MLKKSEKTAIRLEALKLSISLNAGSKTEHIIEVARKFSDYCLNKAANGNA